MASTSPRRRIWVARVAAGLIAVLALCSRAESLDQGEGQLTYREVLAVNLVNVEVFATDKKGQPVSGLTAKDFEVLEDGKKMRLSHFLALGEHESPELPSSATGAAGVERAETGHVVLFVDNFAVQPGNRQQVLEGLRDFLEQGLESDSEFMVVYIASR